MHRDRIKNILKILSAATFVVLFALIMSSYGQTSSILVGGLNRPDKIILYGEHSLLVSEAGTRLPNTGRVSIVDRETGQRRTLVEGLPSAVSFLGGPAGDPDGPSALLRHGNILYVSIGVGDATVPGPGPGQERVNPNPASPLFVSILAITLPEDVESIESGFTLAFADQIALASGNDVMLTNGDGQKLIVSLAANLPDYIPVPLPPPNENNVKASHIYGMDMFQSALYLADAGQNRIKKLDLRTGELSVFTTFPNRPNPLFGTVGGPVLEAVPDNIHRFGNRLLVTLLTGFPFVPGQSEAVSIDLRSGEPNVLIPNLTSAIDIAKADPLTGQSFAESFNTGESSSFYTLEYSVHQFPPPSAPGRLRFYATTTSDPVDALTNLTTPTSMVRDDVTGNVYITNIVPGTITKVKF